MAELSTLIICDSIENIEGTNGFSMPHLIAPQLVLRPMFIPTMMSFSLMIGILDLDLSKENSIEIVLWDPNDKIIQSMQGGFLKAVGNDNSLPDKYNGCTAMVDLRNLIINECGEYSIEVKINGESIGKKILPIYKKG